MQQFIRFWHFDLGFFLFQTFYAFKALIFLLKQHKRPEKAATIDAIMPSCIQSLGQDHDLTQQLQSLKKGDIQ